MRIAPIQVGEIYFSHINVELDTRHLPEGDEAPANVVFDFNNVTIVTKAGMTPLPEGENPGRFLVTLRVQVENKNSKDAEQRFSPYLIDIEAAAQVAVLPGATDMDDKEDLVRVNGTSVLWSAIREQVSSLTARMPAGTVLLPTVNFLDLRKKSLEKGVASTKKSQSKKRLDER